MTVEAEEKRAERTSLPSIAVVGAGSIGGPTASVLARAGHNVEVVCNHEEQAELIRTRGIRLRGKLGAFTVAIPAVARVDLLAGPKDVVFLATKAQDMLKPAADLLPFLTEQSVVVSLQNGVCVDALAEVVGRRRVIGCVVGWGSTYLGDALVEVTSKGSYVIGRPGGSTDDMLSLVQQLLALIFPTRITANIYGTLFSKLMINACINSVGAVTGLPLGPMLGEREVPRLFQAILREAREVAAAAGITIEAYSGQFNLYRVISTAGPAATLLRGLFRALVGALGYADVRSSTLQSILRGRATEIDWLNGYIVELGRRHGVATPVNLRIVEVVKEIEAGTRTMGPENLSPLSRAV